MFLTGFDSPALNTLYVDKNLRFHGLVQAFSRQPHSQREEKPREYRLLPQSEESHRRCYCLVLE
jgi:hypothetical protein